MVAQMKLNNNNNNNIIQNQIQMNFGGLFILTQLRKDFHYSIK